VSCLREEIETHETVLRITTRNKGMCMRLENSTDILIMIVTCEALVQLWFHGAPFQPLRGLLTRLTPFLYSKSQQTHLFDCAYCVSVWIGFLITLAYFYVDYSVFMVICLSLTIHRMSNHLHVFFSLIADRQRDIRVARRK